MKTARIEISGASLEFRINGGNWCRVELDTGESVYKLGAERWDILKERILNALTSLSNSSEPEWMLSLAEEHCTFYRQNVSGKNYFFWQNAQAEQIWASDLIKPVDENQLKNIFRAATL